MSYYAFVKEEEKKIALQEKKHAIWQWTKIVGHKPTIQVLYDPILVQKGLIPKKTKQKPLTLAEAREEWKREHRQNMFTIDHKIYFWKH